MGQLLSTSRFCCTTTDWFARRLFLASGMLNRSSDSEAERYADGSEMIVSLASTSAHPSKSFPLYGEPEPAFLRHFREWRRLGRVTGFWPHGPS